MSIAAIVLKSAPERWFELAMPADPYVSCPGRDFASAIKSFTVRTGSHAGTICQSVQFHVSCSQTPPVMPGYQIGGVLLFDWSAS